MLEQLKNLVKDEEAPTAVEYAIMVAGIGALIVVGVYTLGDSVNDKFDFVEDKITNGAGTSSGG